MKYKPIDPELFVTNRKKFTKGILAQSLAVFNANDVHPRNGDQFYPYRQQSDFFYLTGVEQEKSILILAPDHPDPKKREILFLVETSEHIAIWNGHKLTKSEGAKISGIQNVQWLDCFEMMLRELLFWSKNVYLNHYEYPKYLSDLSTRDERFAKSLTKKFPCHNYQRSAPILTRLRMIKSPAETELIKKAVEITGNAFRRILDFVKPGVTEFEIQAEIEHEFLKSGANGNAYQPIVASGANSCILHYIDNNQVCQDGDVILFDFGAEYANYAADLSRTIPVNGKYTPRQRQLYELVLRVQKKAIGKMYPGNTVEKYNEFVAKEMEREMIGIGLLAEDAVKNQPADKPLYKKYFMHGTAHHVGLDVHDLVDPHLPFAEGMVLTCEPGIYLPEEKIGIRIENNILITSEGPVDLTADIPREPDEIESLMG